MTRRLWGIGAEETFLDGQAAAAERPGELPGRDQCERLERLHWEEIYRKAVAKVQETRSMCIQVVMILYVGTRNHGKHSGNMQIHKSTRPHLFHIQHSARVMHQGAYLCMPRSPGKHLP